MDSKTNSKEVRYLKGMNFSIESLKVDLSVSNIVVGQEQSPMIRSGPYIMAIVRILIIISEKFKHEIKVPFYQSSGVSSSVAGAQTWFPFHCTTLKHGDHRLSFYSQPQHSQTYLYKMGHWVHEPFSLHCFDPYYCGQQQKFIEKYLATAPKVSAEGGQGLGTLISRFSNLIYLTISYFLFNQAGTFGFKAKKGSFEEAYVNIIDKISGHATFGKQSWSQLAQSLNKHVTALRIEDLPRVDMGADLNCVLMLNGVIFPYYELGIDMKSVPANDYFVLNQIFVMLIGELYLNPKHFETWKRFDRVTEKLLTYSSHYRLIERNPKKSRPSAHQWPQILSAVAWAAESFCKKMFWAPVYYRTTASQIQAEIEAQEAEEYAMADIIEEDRIKDEILKRRAKEKPDEDQMDID